MHVASGGAVRVVPFLLQLSETATFRKKGLFGLLTV